MKFTIAVHGAALPGDPVAEAVAPAIKPIVLAADFGINIGGVDSTGNVVAWVSGQSKCNIVTVGAIGSNPCGRPFNLNGRTFTLQGCGGPLSINTGSGAFFANCGVFSEADACGVHSEFHCI